MATVTITNLPDRKEQAMNPNSETAGDLPELIKRIVVLHHSMPDYMVDTIMSAIIADGWQKLPAHQSTNRSKE